ncbi:NAD(P)H-binding protein [Streptomyces sp. MK37H]|uniref:NAD(P)H-binding protein n=1 Tax=Streptomyces sp. MK37H TaxID=2699117 RepID=UPI001B367545|nr:NAD(P)H-binding protein [Streptomyces sp. MK37H]MBP8538767.1 NAD(P)H-binding protein [Streptomyces sp. MK37H]
MIIVTGANGQLGRMVAERLLERVPAEEIGVSVRDVESARDLGARGVRVRRGDFADPDTLPHAFEGASKVLIVSTDTTGETAVRGHRAAIAAAAEAGAKRILYTSHMGANPSSRFAPMPDHAATEEALRQSGVPFTSLRNGFYTSSAVMLVRGALETGVLAVPEDGPVAWTAHADLADAAVLALTGEVLDGLSPALTGPEVIDMAGIAEILTRLTGRPIRRVVVSDDDYRAQLVTHGVPESSADLLVGLFAASRDGDFAPVDPTLADLLGRPAVRVEDYLKSALTPPR